MCYHDKIVVDGSFMFMSYRAQELSWKNIVVADTLLVVVISRKHQFGTATKVHCILRTK